MIPEVPPFTERMRMAEDAWAKYRLSHRPNPPEKMPAWFHAGFSMACGAMVKRWEAESDDS